MRKPQLTIKNGLIPNKDSKGPLLKKATSYQRLLQESEQHLDSLMAEYCFIEEIMGKLKRMQIKTWPIERLIKKIEKHLYSGEVPF